MVKSVSPKILLNITDNMLNNLRTSPSFRITILNINLITHNIRNRGDMDIGLYFLILGYRLEVFSLW